MPVSSKRELITLDNNAATLETSTPLLPGHQEFHQSAVRTVIEAVMREKLDALIGAAWEESSPKAQRVPQRLLYT